MARQSRRSATLLISIHADPEIGGRWYARVMSHRDAIASTTKLAAQTTVEGVCGIVRTWLTDVTDEESSPRDGSVTTL